MLEVKLKSTTNCANSRVHFPLGNTHCVSEKEYFNDATYVVGDGKPYTF